MGRPFFLKKVKLAKLLWLNQKAKMDFVSGKIAAVTAELSRVTKGHIEQFSADALASVIEALVRNKFG